MDNRKNIFIFINIFRKFEEYCEFILVKSKCDFFKFFISLLA